MNEKTLQTIYENNDYPLNLTIEDLDISVLLYNLLKQNKLFTLSDIIKKSEEEISGMSGYNQRIGKELAVVCKEKKLDYFQGFNKPKEEKEGGVISGRRKRLGY